MSKRRFSSRALDKAIKELGVSRRKADVILEVFRPFVDSPKKRKKGKREH